MKEYIVEIVCSVASAVIVSLIAYFAGRTNGKLKKLSYVENGLQALLRHEILSIYKEYKDKKYIPIYEMDNAERMYEEYSKLGGNGMITEKMKFLRTLDNKEEF